MEKRVCWITASYFLDVDLPIVPKLMDNLNIDWLVITSKSQYESDKKYILSQTDKPFELIISEGKFYSYRLYKFCKSLINKIENQQYDWIYFDISDFFFLYPLVRNYLGNKRVTIATHNVSIPRGARYPLLAKLSMRYIINNFNHFQVFSKNQREVLLNKGKHPSIFYCPLMLKDYGNKATVRPSEKVRFLFFGNILQYKRVDLLIQAVNMLVSEGISNFSVDICGYCRPEIWRKKYLPMIKHPEIVKTDIRRIPNELVGEIFSNNDYFVMPYQDIAQSGAMTVALNYNLPIIASDLDTFKEFIDDNYNGYFFKQGNARALADVMRKAINNSAEEYQRLKINLQKMVEENLSEAIIIRKYLDYFETCLNA